MPTIDITPQLDDKTLVVEALGAGGFTIGSQRHEGALLLLPQRVLSWDIPDPQEWRGDTPLSPASLDLLLPHQGGIALWLLGLGPRFRPLSPALRAHARSQGLRLEAMDTAAACRTHTVLATEGRPVAAALLPLP